VLRDPHRKRKIRLPLTGYIETVSYLFAGTDLFVAYSENYGGEGSGHIALIDTVDFKPLWIVEAVNSSPLNPILTSDGVLVGGWGSLALLDAQTGKSMWEHDDLRQLTGYYNFDTVRFVNDEVEICSGKCLQRDRDTSMIVVQLKTGKIIQPRETRK
jgi:hypothetical protein